MEKETIKLVKKMIEDGNLSQEVAEKYIPELKESKDERIRKWIISTLKSLISSPVQIDGAYEMMLPAISWLEKQGEHANLLNKIQIGDKVTRNEDGVLVNLSQLKRVTKKDEQKPVEKFYSNGLEEEIEVWVGEKAFPEGTKITPLPEAIKIVRETALHFQKWEAARHIDGRSLEEQLEAKQNLTWSEKDESMRTRCIGILGKCYMGELPTKVEEELNWLKSIRPKSQWKPSDEQMKAFDAVLVYNPPCSNECRNHLITLYNELKKLREE